MSAGRPRAVVRVLAPLAMMGAIFYFSSQPFDGPDLAWWEVAVRKLGHVAGYAALTGLWWWALLGEVRRLVAAGVGAGPGTASAD